MARKTFLRTLLGGSALSLLFAATSSAQDFDIPPGDLKSALNQYTASTGVDLIYPADLMQKMHTDGARGSLSPDAALTRLLKGTGFTMRRAAGGIAIVHNMSSDTEPVMPLELAQATPAPHAAVETVTVTSSKLGGADVQSIPIAITALSQEQLTATQTAGGPDLVKQVPNLTFSKTNFTGYNIQIRGIGTQAISVATDPAVAVAFNDIPFLRNHFFEQEFFDVSQVEVLRGPQGTLYGRNATAGVINLISAKPSDQFEAMASVDVGNYHGRRIEGMINVPIVDDRFDLRVAGELTKRDGYSFNDVTNEPIDGRDLWSTRVTLGFKPIERLQTYLVWEHFTEGDDRLRSSKQLCERDPGPNSVGNVTNIDPSGHGWLSQGCLPGSLYSPASYQTVNGNALPYVVGLQYVAAGYAPGGGSIERADPYASANQSPNLRVIQSALTPTYKASNDVVEFNADFAIMPGLTLTSQTGYNHDRIASTEDFNRFTTAPGIFSDNTVRPPPTSNPFSAPPTPNGEFCDPQLGCSNRLVAEDLSQARSWQISQEFRLASNFSGPLNFNLGGNYLHYETLEDYYVFVNMLTFLAQAENQVGSSGSVNQGVGDFTHCDQGLTIQHNYLNPGNTGIAAACVYIDPNPLSSLTGNGHNYFRSTNPYTVNSYAGFGEAYYQVAPDLKLTGGLRWTDDQKHFVDIPSWVATPGWGYPVTGIVDQEWKEFTGRFVATWTPKLDFTDQSLFYGSFSRGYKGGGANPPGPAVGLLSSASASDHPLTFAPEFNNAFELGTKNTLGDGAVTLNGDVFYYDYKGYQISEIIDRTSINLNIDAKVKGAELESTWEPIPGLRFNLSAGYETSRIDNGQSTIDLLDRTAGHSDWMIVHPFITGTSNCVLPRNVVGALISGWRAVNGGDDSHPIPDANQSYDVTALIYACPLAYSLHIDPGSFVGVNTGFDPSTAPNGGAGFSKDLGGNDLPNTPHLTLSWGAQYSMPVTPDWAATLRGDFYYQSDSWARVFNDNPYDHLQGYTNLNLALILTSQNGWQAMGYMKNVFNTTAITGSFLNSDDTGLTTNVFVTDPRLFGIRVTKNW